MVATQNYSYLSGAANLYKCFLPQAWQFGAQAGVSAFVHPDGVYDDPKGGVLRETLYPKLRYHFQFTNGLKLFPEVDHHTGYSLNVYNNTDSSEFESISNLFAASTIEECYDDSINGNIPGIKDENGNWNTHGHPGRIVRVEKKELKLFANLFDGNANWKQASLASLHTETMMDLIEAICDYRSKISDEGNNAYGSTMWGETSSQKDGTIERNIHFPTTLHDMIISGPHFHIANPFFKASRSICEKNSDYDIIDLSNISNHYIQRCNYSPLCSTEEYNKRMPDTSFGEKYNTYYRIVCRRMMGLNAERSLISAIIPPQIGHIHTVTGVCFSDLTKLPSVAGTMNSIVFDTYIRILGKTDLYFSAIQTFPLIINNNTAIRALLLNCLTESYSYLFEKCWCDEYNNETWSKSDPRLDNKRFSTLTSEWTWDTPLRTDYERRQALVEIDVLTAMALGMTLEQLKTIYRIQFPVLQQYEADTWYDANGRIVFTTNRSLVGVGFDRKQWEANVKGAPSGRVFTREIEDDTQPGGPVKRTIEYVALFDRCDREQDYETAWKFFEEKYGK